MKFVRFDAGSGPAAGVLVEDMIIPFASAGVPYETVSGVMADGDQGLSRVARAIAGKTGQWSKSEVRLLPPIEHVGKFLAIGMNYAKHVQEAEALGVEEPKQQFWFNKQTTCIVGPHDEIDPGASEQLDYEVELGAVIGKRAKYVSESDALDYVFGYLVVNDVSARDWQFHSPTFTMGKSFDTHGPIGPWLVTADEIEDPQAIGLRCLVNGEVRQEGNTRDMIHKIAAQIAYLSTAFTLEPGDIIATGTPEGVGIGMKPPQFLQPGDVVTCEADGIGAIENRIGRSSYPS